MGKPWCLARMASLVPYRGEVFVQLRGHRSNYECWGRGQVISNRKWPQRPERMKIVRLQRSGRVP